LRYRSDRTILNVQKYENDVRKRRREEKEKENLDELQILSLNKKGRIIEARDVDRMRWEGRREKEDGEGCRMGGRWSRIERRSEE
jgi:hypothetical protein